MRRLKKLNEKINKVNYIISDEDIFDKKMQKIGYERISNNFLIKNFNNIEINISQHDERIVSIIGYENNDTIDLDKELLSIVKSEVESCL